MSALKLWMENVLVRPRGALLSRDLPALLDHQAVRWTIILFTAAVCLLFAQANQFRIYGDAIRYSGEASAMADAGE